MRTKRTRRNHEVSHSLWKWRDRELTGEIRGLHSQVSKLDMSTQEAMVGIDGLTRKTDEVRAAIRNHDLAQSDSSAYQTRLAYLSIFGSMAASLFSAAAAVASIINRNTAMFLLGSIATFFIVSILWIKMNSAELETREDGEV